MRPAGPPRPSPLPSPRPPLPHPLIPLPHPPPPPAARSFLSLPIHSGGAAGKGRGGNGVRTLAESDLGRRGQEGGRNTRWEGRPQGWGLAGGTQAAARFGRQDPRAAGTGIRQPRLGAVRGSSYLRGEAPGPGGGGGSGCGARARRQLLHHNIPRPGARGPRGRARSGGGARGAGVGEGRHLGPLGGRAEGPSLLRPAASGSPAPPAPSPAAVPAPGWVPRSQRAAPASADPRPARHRPPPGDPGLTLRAPQGPGPAPPPGDAQTRLERERRWRCPGRGRVGRGWRRPPARLLRQHSLTSWW